MKKTLIASLLIPVALTACQSITEVEKTLIQPVALKAQTEFTLYTTAKTTGQRLAEEQKSFEAKGKATEADIAVYVNLDSRFQRLLGIGGAITDASAEVFAKLPDEKQQEMLKAYYDVEQGIGYSLARTPIHSSDFSSASFTYIEEGDKELETFSIDHDQQFRIPLIKKATQAAGGALTLYASPWSAPAFMKSNNNMLHGGSLLPEYYDAWATYYTKFIKAYEQEGMPIWGITIQNEPAAVQIWESMNYTAEQERDFLKNHLGPIMAQEGLADKNIVVWDHNRDMATHWGNTVFGDPEAAKYAWGLGFHWYETWAGGDSMQNNLAAIAESYPDKKLLFTEGTNEAFDSAKYEHWPNAERYGEAMIRDFNVGTVGWTDWNILLDQHGGPNHVGNFCFAPIHADLESGELIYTPSYYYIGHFSKFIRPEAQRVSTVSNRSFLLTTSFINTDGKVATVVMNKTDNALKYNLNVSGVSAHLEIPARAMQTIVY